MFHVNESMPEWRNLKRNVDNFIFPKRLQKNHHIMAIMNDNIYISMIYYSIIGDKCQICYIHTSQKHRRHGHSMTLVKKLLEICAQNEIKKIFVSILPDCGSDKLFEKLRFSFIDNNIMCLVL
jgi:N-acetylglutamate synthase-like GNAT family acetyltransferase